MRSWERARVTTAAKVGMTICLVGWVMGLVGMVTTTPWLQWPGFAVFAVGWLTVAVDRVVLVRRGWRPWQGALFRRSASPRD